MQISCRYLACALNMIHGQCTTIRCDNKWAHLPGGALPTLGNAFNGLISLKLGKIESSWGYSLSIWLDLQYHEYNEIAQIESGAFNKLILLE